MPSIAYMTQQVLNLMGRVSDNVSAGMQEYSQYTQGEIDALKFDEIAPSRLSGAEKSRADLRKAMDMLDELKEKNLDTQKHGSIASYSAKVGQNIKDKKTIIRELEKAKSLGDPERAGVSYDPTEKMSAFKDLFEHSGASNLKQMRNAIAEGPTGYRQLMSDPESWEDYTEVSRQIESQYMSTGEWDGMPEARIRWQLDRQAKMGLLNLDRNLRDQHRYLEETTEDLAKKYSEGLTRNRLAAAEAQQAENIKTANAQQAELEKSIQTDQQSLATAGDSPLSEQKVQTTNAVEEQRPI